MEEKIAADSTVCSNFSLVGKPEILKRVFGKELCTTKEVAEELKLGEQRGVLPPTDWSWLKVLKVESPEEISLFRRLNGKFGKGESSCMAIAANRGFKILTDDLDMRKFAQRKGIPISGTIGVLVVAVLRGFINIEEGNKLLSEMMRKGYYSPINDLKDIRN